MFAAIIWVVHAAGSMKITIPTISFGVKFVHPLSQSPSNLAFDSSTCGMNAIYLFIAFNQAI